MPVTNIPPPKAPPISAPEGPMLTLAMPQSEPRADRNVSASRRSLVKIEDDRPCGTALCSGSWPEGNDGDQRVIAHNRSACEHSRETRAETLPKKPVCLADEAVSGEPVCEANSLLSGKKTGNFAKSLA
jgi:hypothetical protein